MISNDTATTATTSNRVRIGTMTVLQYKASINAATIEVYPYTKKDGTVAKFFIAKSATGQELMRGNVKDDYMQAGTPNVSIFEGDEAGTTFCVMHKCGAAAENAF